MLNYVRQIFKISVVFTRFISETKSMTPNYLFIYLFFAFLTQ